ncbi:hypothetical protein STEG23_022550, partial [Scotinomys teguina]
WLKSEALQTAYVGEDVEQGEHSSAAGGSGNWYSHFGNQYGGSSENWESAYLKTYTTLGHISKECSVIPQGHMLNYVHSSVIHNIQNLETT